MTENYTLVRSRRRSIGLQIKQDATLIIRAPHFVSQKMIDQVIREKRSWIEKTKERMLRLPSKPIRDFSKDPVLYLGKEYHVEITSKPCVALRFESSRFLLSEEYLSHAKTMLTRWYREQALTYLPDRVRHFAQKADVSYQLIKVNAANTRWGSCSERGSLNFSWRIMMAPPEVIDYVVAHEVAHLKHPNHSRAFWTFVAFLCPDYQVQKKWLNQKGDQLAI